MLIPACFVFSSCTGLTTDRLLFRGQLSRDRAWSYASLRGVELLRRRHVGAGILSLASALTGKDKDKEKEKDGGHNNGGSTDHHVIPAYGTGSGSMASLPSSISYPPPSPYASSLSASAASGDVLCPSSLSLSGSGGGTGGSSGQSARRVPADQFVYTLRLWFTEPLEGSAAEEALAAASAAAASAATAVSLSGPAGAIAAAARALFAPVPTGVAVDSAGCALLTPATAGSSPGVGGGVQPHSLMHGLKHVDLALADDGKDEPPFHATTPAHALFVRRRAAHTTHNASLTVSNASAGSSSTAGDVVGGSGAYSVGGYALGSPTSTPRGSRSISVSLAAPTTSHAIASTPAYAYTPSHSVSYNQSAYSSNGSGAGSMAAPSTPAPLGPMAAFAAGFGAPQAATSAVAAAERAAESAAGTLGLTEEPLLQPSRAFYPVDDSAAAAAAAMTAAADPRATAMTVAAAAAGARGGGGIGAVPTTVGFASALVDLMTVSRLWEVAGALVFHEGADSALASAATAADAAATEAEADAGSDRDPDGSDCEGDSDGVSTSRALPFSISEFNGAGSDSEGEQGSNGSGGGGTQGHTVADLDDEAKATGDGLAALGTRRSRGLSLSMSVSQTHSQSRSLSRTQSHCSARLGNAGAAAGSVSALRSATFVSAATLLGLPKLGLSSPLPPALTPTPSPALAPSSTGSATASPVVAVGAGAGPGLSAGSGAGGSPVAGGGGSGSVAAPPSVFAADATAAAAAAAAQGPVRARVLARCVGRFERSALALAAHSTAATEGVHRYTAAAMRKLGRTRKEREVYLRVFQREVRL